MTLISPLKLPEDAQQYSAELDRLLMVECYTRSLFSTATMPIVAMMWWWITGDEVNQRPVVRLAYALVVLLPMLRAIVYWRVNRPGSRASTRVRFGVYALGATMFGAAIGGWSYVVHPHLDQHHISLVVVSIAGLCVVSLVNTAAAPVAYLAFLFGAVTPSLVRMSAGLRAEETRLLSLEVVVFVFTLCILSFGVHASLRQTLLLTLQLRDVALRDPLTGLPNRRALLEHPRNAQENGGRSMLMIDIDWFKSINDTHGHDTGDLVLKQTAEVLRECIRAEDFVARWGGEEFIVDSGGVSATVALAIAERIRLAVERKELVAPDGGLLSCTCSIGVCWVAGDRTAPTAAMLRAADTALYRAKRLGRNRVEMARPEELDPPADAHAPRALKSLA